MTHQVHYTISYQNSEKGAIYNSCGVSPGQRSGIISPATGLPCGMRSSNPCGPLLLMWFEGRMAVRDAGGNIFHLYGWITKVIQPLTLQFAKPALRAQAAAFASACCSFGGWVAHAISSLRLDKSGADSVIAWQPHRWNILRYTDIQKRRSPRRRRLKQERT